MWFTNWHIMRNTRSSRSLPLAARPFHVIWKWRAGNLKHTIWIGSPGSKAPRLNWKSADPALHVPSGKIMRGVASALGSRARCMIARSVASRLEAAARSSMIESLALAMAGKKGIARLVTLLTKDGIAPWRNRYTTSMTHTWLPTRILRCDASARAPCDTMRLNPALIISIEPAKVTKVDQKLNQRGLRWRVRPPITDIWMPKTPRMKKKTTRATRTKKSPLQTKKAILAFS
mmetsp:Transcript_31175/g.96335  ORF Transcript_31175/g.96335 Transcript_31175/m.96335 type:complete len:232 (+) Transcript_31175:391-1086(+)